MPRAPRSNSGSRLNIEWRVFAADAKYHQEGKFFMPLNHFPGALFDPHGYILFRTEEEYINCKFISIGQRINVPGGISSIPRYRRMK